MNHQGPHIQVKGLWKIFGDDPERALQPEYAAKSRSEIQDELGAVVGLRDVSFNVDRGQIFVVMGLSGSGKSTLVRCLIRLVEATKGQIYFDGEDILSYSPDQLMQFRRHRIAMVFQHYALLPHRRVIDNVAYGLEIRGMEKESRYKLASEAIETVGLKGWEDYYPSEMSGGMQQRVGLARALAVDPEVLLMDEPFSGLDPLIRSDMRDELMSLQDKLRKTIVFITHDLDEALKLGDRVAIMRDGAVVQEGSPEEIVTKPADKYVANFVKDVSWAKVIRTKAIMDQPEAVIHEREDPGTALQTMRENSAQMLFFVGRDRVLNGLIARDEVNALADQNENNLEKARIQPAMTAGPDSYIEKIIPMAAVSDHPIAVVDERGRLLGEVRRAALLAGMTPMQ